MTVSDVSPEISVFVNPAVLTNGNKFKAAFSQARLSTEDFEYSISSDVPLVKNKIVLGFGWDSLASQNQLATGIVRDSNGQVVIDPTTGLPLTQILGFFTRNSNEMYFSVGGELGPCSLGASLKGLLTDFGNLEGYGVGLDVGFDMRLDPTIVLGAVLYDVGGSIVDFQGKAFNTMIRSSWDASLSWRVLNDKRWSISVEPGFSQTTFDSSSVNWQGGIEVSWMKDFFLRLGCNQSRPSFGVGLVVHPPKILSELKMDYAYLGGDENDYPSRLTLTMGW